MTANEAATSGELRWRRECKVQAEITRAIDQDRREQIDNLANTRVDLRERDERIEAQDKELSSRFRAIEELHALMGQARAHLIVSHHKRYPSHLKGSALQENSMGYRIGCATCDVIQAMGRSAR